MKTDKRHMVLIWLVVFLAVMNISTFVTIGYHVYQTNKMDKDSMENQKKLEEDAEKYSGRYFRDQLNLDGDQMYEFRQFNRIFRISARSITLALADKRKLMLAEMVKTSSDTSKLMVISDSIGILHGQLKQLTFKYYLDIKEICNEEQQVRLQQLFLQMFINDAQMAFPGNPVNGQGRGRQQNNTN